MHKKAQIPIFMGLFWIIFLLLCNLSYANPLWINTECNSQNPQLHPTVFEWRFYLQHNEDLIRQGIVEPNQACTHWLKEGLTQGRRTHWVLGPRIFSRPNFDINDNTGLLNSK